MDQHYVTVIAALLVVVCCTSPSAKACEFPAIFAFGTSLTDTGNGRLSNPLFYPASRPPYGETYFRRPTSRFSDGRLMIDLLAQALGLPFLPPYLAAKKLSPPPDLSQGINYAVAGATVQGLGKLLLNADVTVLTRDSLGVQVNWHLSIKQAVHQPTSPPAFPGVTLPAPETFSKSLYYFEFGGNDYGTNLLSRHLFPPQSHLPINNSYLLSVVVPLVVNKLSDAIELLYANDARNFFILNIFPEGCSPLFLKFLNGTKDQYGCLSAFNEVDDAHNQLLLSTVEGLRSKYADITLIYADGASAYARALQNPVQYGFTERIVACCGAGPGVPYQFALKRICGPGAYNCSDPSKYVVWDGIHNTEAFNKFVINSFIAGQDVNPPKSLSCASLVT